MAIALKHLFVCDPRPPDSLQHFVNSWADQYYYPNSEVYERHVKGPHTAESLRKLFAWKIGARLASTHLPRIEEQFINRLPEASRSREKLAGCDSHAAKDFLTEFNEGGAVYRIFWLHCWQPGFPIFDQHVYRAMTRIRDGEARELGKIYGENNQVECYLTTYLPFFAEFNAIGDDRQVDKALWQFGKSLKRATVSTPNHEQI
jgi:hypothetical protein